MTRAAVGRCSSAVRRYEVGVEEGVERGEAVRVGGCRAEGDVAIGPHQQRTGWRGARAPDDVDEPVPAVTQALDLGRVRVAGKQEAMARAAQRRAAGEAVARCGRRRLRSRADVLPDEGLPA
jgi:hypothetical protein